MTALVPFLLKLQINTPEFKYTLVFVTAPLWLSFLRLLWNELNDMLAEEGGLFGREPNEKELLEIQRRRAKAERALVLEKREEKTFFRGRKAGNAMPNRRGFGPPRT